MDTSETYIKQCEKAKEIQNLRYIPDKRDYWDIGDYIFWKVDNSTLVGFGESGIQIHCDCWSEDWHPSNSIWLPRQDQLQEMIEVNPFTLLAPIYDFAMSVNHASLRHIHYFKSMEQLWLAFVMKEKFNKVWNGEDWEDK